ncbi:MAG: hypothetical protein Q4B05_03735 [Candidatus Saccharibacteria bacterium]|nr:hypothetical protein [Candidatus Saccharibacteria bacterium]
MRWTVVAQVLGKADDLGIPSKQGVTSELATILNTIYLIAGAIAVLMVVIAGINYTTSGGDANKLTKAKNTIIYSVAGLVVIGMAFVITNFIIEGATK